MIRLALRISSALLGATLATALFAVLESWAIGAGFAPCLLAELGVLAPITAVIFLGMAVVVAFEPLLIDPVTDRIKAARGPGRARVAAGAPIVVLGIFLWSLGAAHVMKEGMGAPTPSSTEAGLVIALGSLGVSILGVVTALAVVPMFARVIGKIRTQMPAAAEPRVTTSAALAVVLVLAVIGIFTGGPSGAGGVPFLGILGVFTRSELDLRPVAEVLFIAAAAFVAPRVIVGKRHTDRDGRVKFVCSSAAVAGWVSIFMMFGLCIRASTVLNAEPAVADGLANTAPVGKIAMGLLRRLTDKDHDGYASKFGGGDCNDNDKAINPAAIDIPGNGIDEDCTGADTPVPPEPPPPPVVLVPKKPKRTYNVIFITIDTLRADLGFSGYPKPVTPNLDQLAAKGTVFEHTYSMASFTAKAVGPLHIGKYPSECNRDWGHFTVYYPSNTFMAERLQQKGHRTIGGMCHYYFKWKTGYDQGFDVWDTSAIAPGMADNDISITSDRLTDLALKLLGDPANTSLEGQTVGENEPKRFFAWFHYFDPHLQYVHHAGAPDFKSLPGGAGLRPIYDEEVWFTDKHIGRLIDWVNTQPWAKDTAIVVTADHGEGFGEHGIVGHGREIWNPLVRIPLIVYVPGADPKRVVPNRSSIDFAPTVIDLMGVTAPPGELRGTSLLEDIYGDAGDRDVFIDMPEGQYNEVRHALVYGPAPGMKLLHFGGSRYQLFDLEADPDESKDLSNRADLFTPAKDRMSNFRARLKEVAVSGEKGQ